MTCNQVCPYNTIDGCKRDKYNADCPIANTDVSAKHDKSSHWIDVGKVLPRYHIDVLVARKTGKVTMAYRGKNDRFKSCRTDYEFDDITHWMPLPQPPKEME